MDASRTPPTWPRSSSRGPSFRHLELEPACLADPLGSVHDFQGNQISLLVVIENYARLALVAVDDAGVGLEDDAQGVRAQVIGSFHDPALRDVADTVDGDDFGRPAVRPFNTTLAAH